MTDNRKQPMNAAVFRREMEKTAGFLELGKFCVKLDSTLYWLQQGVGDKKQNKQKHTFLRSFKQRLVDMFIQEWSGAVRDKDRYEIYRSFKTIFEKEVYFKHWYILL